MISPLSILPQVRFFFLFLLIVRLFMLDSCRFFTHFSVAANLFAYCLIHSFIHLFYYNHPTVHNPSIDFNPCSICQFLYMIFPSYPRRANFFLHFLTKPSEPMTWVGSARRVTPLLSILRLLLDSMKATQLEHARALLTGKGVKLSPYINTR